MHGLLSKKKVEIRLRCKLCDLNENENKNKINKKKKGKRDPRDSFVSWAFFSVSIELPCKKELAMVAAGAADNCCKYVAIVILVDVV